MRVEKFVLNKKAFQEQVLQGNMTAEHLEAIANEAKPPGNTIVVDTTLTPTRVRVRIVDESWRAMFREAREGHLSGAIGLAAGDKKIYYTTKAGKRRLATQAQIAHWARGRR